MKEITDELRRHYAGTFQEHGATSAGVDWGTNDERAALRYEKMLEVVRPSGETRSLLDVGCGYGGLLAHARNVGTRLRYTGIDVVDEMVKWASENHVDAIFQTADIMEWDHREQFDYVVCNGILTQKLSVPGLTMDQYAAGLINKMYDLCRIGIAFNVMTTKVNFFSNNLYYRNPVELLGWCLSELTPHVRLDHAYPLYEYTLYLFREPQ